MLHRFPAFSFHHFKTNVIIDAGGRQGSPASTKQLRFGFFFCLLTAGLTELESTEGAFLFFLTLYLSLVRGGAPLWLPKPISGEFRAASFEPCHFLKSVPASVAVLT